MKTIDTTKGGSTVTVPKKKFTAFKGLEINGTLVTERGSNVAIRLGAQATRAVGELAASKQDAAVLAGVGRAQKGGLPGRSTSKTGKVTKLWKEHLAEPVAA